MRFIVAAIIAVALAGVSRADDVVATVGGTQITRSTLDKTVKAKLIEIDNERYEALKEGLDELIAQELFTQEAKAKGTTPDALLKAEVDAKVGEPSDAEIQQVYDANKAQLGGQTLEQVKPRIVEFLKGQKAEARKQQYVNELKAKYKTTVALRAPVVEVATAGRPEKGPKDAPITMIVFSDYECPFCRRAEETVEQVLKAYDGKIRYVFRDYPLPFHKSARPAAIAAACANEQGKYWDMNNKLFKIQLSPDTIKQAAKDSGLDMTKFDACVAKNDQKAIEQDIADGGTVGVNGTPAFFINGRMISGAQPIEAFKDIIDDELSHGGGKS
ncbi:MAG TPA: thioredoxin domain-containing protein [Candidatus Eisenbacteria bacterium]|nr:thioredoxin domain-containing protein [Candidatus Eisenbacteria bacterium]